MKRFAKEDLGRDGIVQSAAPPDTAAYLINGKALQSPLFACWHEQMFCHFERLKGMQDTFSNIGILFIEEKSMVGQKIFTMVLYCLVLALQCKCR